MDGMFFFGRDADTAQDKAAEAHEVRTAVLMTALAIVVTVGIVLGLGRMGVHPPLAAEEFVLMPLTD